MAGELIARAILDGDTTWQLFAHYELVWAGGMAGRAFGQARYWWFRTAERIAARRGQRHETPPANSDIKEMAESQVVSKTTDKEEVACASVEP